MLKIIVQITATVLLIALVVGTAIYQESKHETECKARGGAYISGRSGYLCVDSKILR